MLTLVGRIYAFPLQQYIHCTLILQHNHPRAGFWASTPSCIDYSSLSKQEAQVAPLFLLVLVRSAHSDTHTK